MPTPITSIPNLGPASAAAFGRAGITSAEEIRPLGPDAAYLRLLDTGVSPHFIGYYVLVMGLQGRPWNDCRGEEKKALRRRFDALCEKARPQHPPGIDAALDAIGVIDRARLTRR